MAWRRAAGMAFALWLLLSAPWAAAAAVEGTLRVESGATFPKETRVDFEDAILLAPTSESTYALELRAEVVHVRLHEQRRVNVGIFSASLQQRMSTWTLTDVVLASIPTAPDDDSIVIETTPGTPLSLLPSQAFELLHRRESVLNNDGAVHSDNGPSRPWYERHVREIHLRVDSAGRADVQGNALLRVQGPDLDVSAAENRTTIWTGTRPDGAETLQRWAFLFVENATLTLTSPLTPLQAVGGAAAVGWSGRAAMVARGGALVGEDATYAGEGPVVLEGRLTARVRPDDASTSLLMEGVRGDLVSTTLTSRPHPRPPVASPFGIGLVAGAVLATAGGAAVLAYRRRTRARARQPPMRPAEAYQFCLDWADYFERNEDAAAALECLQAARSHAEEDEHVVVLWEATCHERLGNLEEALERYEAAMALAPKGDSEATFAAAMVAAQLRREEAALTDLRLALMADPKLLDTVEAFEEDEDPFRDLRAHPEFKRLLRDARVWARTLE